MTGMSLFCLPRSHLDRIPNKLAEKSDEGSFELDWGSPGELAERLCVKALAGVQGGKQRGDPLEGDESNGQGQEKIRCF